MTKKTPQDKPGFAYCNTASNGSRCRCEPGTHEENMLAEIERLTKERDELGTDCVQLQQYINCLEMDTVIPGLKAELATAKQELEESRAESVNAVTIAYRKHEALKADLLEKKKSLDYATKEAIKSANESVKLGFHCERLEAELSDYESLNIVPRRRLCKCGRKPKLRVMQYGFKDSDEFYKMECSCGRSYGDFREGENHSYSEKDCVKGWNKTHGKYDAALSPGGREPSGFCSQHHPLDPKDYTCRVCFPPAVEPGGQDEGYDNECDHGCTGECLECKPTGEEK